MVAVWRSERSFGLLPSRSTPPLSARDDVGLGEADDGVTVFAVGRRGDFAAELVGEELHAVADAQDREAGLEDVGGRLRGAFVVDGCGAAGEDEAARVQALDLLTRSVVGDQHAVDVALAHAPGDEHGVLRAEVEDDDCLAGLRCFDGLSTNGGGLGTNGCVSGGGLEVRGKFEVFGGRVGALGIRFAGGGWFHDGMIARGRGQGNEFDKQPYQFWWRRQPGGGNGESTRGRSARPTRASGRALRVVVRRRCVGARHPAKSPERATCCDSMKWVESDRALMPRPYNPEARLAHTRLANTPPR